MLLPSTTGSYGLNGPRCTLKNGFPGWAWRICLIFLPGFTFWLIAIVMHFKTYCILRKSDFDPNKKLLLKRLSLFPTLLLFDMMPYMIFRIMEELDFKCDNDTWLTICTGIFALHGFFNALLFASTNSLVKKIKLNAMKSKGNRSVFHTDSFGSFNLLLDADKEKGLSGISCNEVDKD
jgi:hypothetical protein